MAKQRRPVHTELDEHATSPAARARPAPRPPMTDIPALQRLAGNRAVTAALGARVPVQRDVPDLAGFTRTAHSERAPAWNARADRHGRAVDPEQPRGTLPFTVSGWNGAQIASRMSQLNIAVNHNDAYSCVETSTVVELVLVGPGAVRDAILHYLQHYERAANSGTPAALRHRMQTAGSLLRDVLRALDEQTMSYADLARLPANMFLVHGSAANHDTSFAEEEALLQQEGYQRTGLNLIRQTREQVAELAAQLAPGQFLSCGVDAQHDGTREPNHNVHITRTASGALLFYDPWPRTGSQTINLSPDLIEIEPYFLGRVNHRPVVFRFDVEARFGRRGLAAQ